MNISWRNGAGKWGAIPINESTQLTSFHLFVTIITDRPPFLAGIVFVSVELCETGWDITPRVPRKNPELELFPYYLYKQPAHFPLVSQPGEVHFFDLIPGPENIEKYRLIHSSLAEFKVISVNRRFGTILCWYIKPGASCGQNIQDAVDQSAGVTSRSANMWLRWGRCF